MKIDIDYNKEKETINNFSIVVTERCNLHCTYCHFFSHVSRTSANDISDELFEEYMKFISEFRDRIGGEVTYRFSGGDPIVLGDRLFELGNKGYELTKIKPYFLTAGNGINDNWIEKARKSAFTHAFVSLENPLNPDPGSIDPIETMKKIAKYSSDDFKLELGCTVIRNEDFKEIYNICKMIYEETGKLPKLQEINFLPYKSPTDKEFEELYENLVKVIEEFYSKAPLDFFPYISPEFNAGHDKKTSYLMELNMNNLHKIGEVPFEEAMESVIARRGLNYPKGKCTNEKCDWYNECKNVKWLWVQKSNFVTAEQKFKDYCKFKRAINQAFYDALIKNKK